MNVNLLIGVVVGFLVSLIRPYLPVIISRNRYNVLISRSIRLKAVRSQLFKSKVNASQPVIIEDNSDIWDLCCTYTNEDECEHFFNTDKGEFDR